MARQPIPAYAILWSVLLLGQLGCTDGSGDGGAGGAPSLASQFPCQAVGSAAAGAGWGVFPGSPYAQSIIRQAAQIGGVTFPTGGVFEIPGMSNAYYLPAPHDAIAYDPIWLNQLNWTTGGGLEAGDSVLFHETGHMWAHKSGIAQCLGVGTTQSNWNHEYQADSYAGYILRLLGGSAQPSVTVYTTVFGTWSPSHPPGTQRAQVFVEAWTSVQPHNFCTQSLLSVRSITIVEVLGPASDEERVRELVEPAPIVLDDAQSRALGNLLKLALLRDRLTALGLNPYARESGPRFTQLCLEEGAPELLMQ